LRTELYVYFEAAKIVKKGLASKEILILGTRKLIDKRLKGVEKVEKRR
jgi:hypothetical protein